MFQALLVKCRSWSRLVASAIACFCLLFAGELTGQSQKSLEEKRLRLTKEIEVTNRLLQKATKSKNATYDRFVALQNQIERRETLIVTIADELAATEDNLLRSAEVINSLSLDLESMKAEYGRMVRHAFRRQSMTNPLLYILSAGSLNEAFRRLMFLRKYNNWRRGQAEAIAFTQQMLAKKMTALGQQKQAKEELLASMQGQKTTLDTELEDKNELLQSLNADEVRLSRELSEKQAEKAKLDQAIEQVITAGVAKRAEEKAKKKKETPVPAAKKVETTPAPTPAPAQPKPVAVEKPAPVTPAPAPKRSAPVEEPVAADDDTETRSFSQQKGRLMWPVSEGFIARGFGRQKHPTLKNIEITNNGIDIRTDENAPVRVVFEGKVVGVQYIPGHDFTVIVQHGNYYTVYANLSETPLAKGDEVRTGQVIGSVSTNPISGAAELHFELWQEKERQNPAKWIK
jgi:murein hydrolase activator